ncbi:hypothetical protein OPT61_g7027 [Boeremia exigua]|uniref:Uncharacterized protein n=1 Tax=Boeremia exigua TaxID=749465 RepID=A0ACC2I3Z6_9PLEO|nr:hypothetical protein OPT61_g7027 [Boeremia exigua]
MTNPSLHQNTDSPNTMPSTRITSINAVRMATKKRAKVLEQKKMQMLRLCEAKSEKGEEGEVSVPVITITPATPVREYMDESPAMWADRAGLCVPGV